MRSESTTLRQKAPSDASTAWRLREISRILQRLSGKQCQKVRRKPNCSLRIALAEVITPKVVDVAPEGTEAFGCPRFTMLNTFVPSARNRRLKRSLNLKSRE